MSVVFGILGIIVIIFGILNLFMMFGETWVRFLPGSSLIVCGILCFHPDYAYPLGLWSSVVCFIITIIWLFVSCESYSEQTKSKSEKSTALDSFFVECVLAEADDFSKPKNKQRAELLADKYNLEYPNGIEALYQQGLDEHKAVSRRIEQERQRLAQDRLNAKRAEEKEKMEHLSEYSVFFGTAKRVTMLSAIADDLYAKAENLEQYAKWICGVGRKPELDWASLGGLASGIAGAGAGIAVAMDIQLQNMQIRAENAQQLATFYPLIEKMRNAASENRQAAERTIKEIEEAKMKLVSEDDPMDLIKKIYFCNTSVTVSETGTATVHTSASVSSKLKIFDDVPAVIDGTIIAEIYDKNQLCGTAQLVLPLYGLVGKNTSLEGMCLDCCKPGKKYTVKFTAENLWAMEE